MVVFENVNDGLFNAKKCMKDWCEKYTSKKCYSFKLSKYYFVRLAKAIVGNPIQVWICVVSMGKTYVCKVSVA